MKNFLKELLTNIGLAIMVGGVGYLIYIVHTGIQTNLTLGISLGIILFGLLSYITLNKRQSK